LLKAVNKVIVSVITIITVISENLIPTAIKKAPLIKIERVSSVKVIFLISVVKLTNLSKTKSQAHLKSKDRNKWPTAKIVLILIIRINLKVLSNF